MQHVIPPPLSSKNSSFSQLSNELNSEFLAITVLEIWNFLVILVLKKVDKSCPLNLT